MMVAIEEKARQDGCGRIRVETFGNEKGLYEKMGYRIVGELDDYPEGYTYCWMRKGLDL
jgi:ribosomal protein S18 acetylase RimI-like enzyme